MMDGVAEADDEGQADDHKQLNEQTEHGDDRKPCPGALADRVWIQLA
jgi:hypothetical protein